MSSLDPKGSESRQPAGAWFLFSLVVALGILAGWMEAAQHIAFRSNPGILTINKVPPDAILWVAPVFYVALFLPTGLACWGLTAVVRRWQAPALLLGCCAFVSAFGQLTLTGGIHRWGAVALALGAAVALVRGARARPGALRILGQAAPVLAVVVALIWAGAAIAQTIRERNALAGLPEPAAQSPNVLLIVLDTVRADHMSLYGYPRATTPQLDAWARRGVTFDNAWTVSSWTLPAHASMLTGRPAYEHGADRGRGLDGRFPLLSEFLRDRGYRTGGFVGNAIWLVPEYGFDRGFARWRVYSPWKIAARTVFGRRAYNILSDRLRLHHLPVRRMAPEVNADFLDWLDNTPPRPFFALLNYMDAHDPYWPPPPYDRKFQDPAPGKPERYKNRRLFVSAYDNLISYLDDHVDAMLRELEQRGLLSNTIVIITSDHGESLSDHDQFQHGDSLYRELCRAPFIVLAPGAPAGTRVEASLSVQQIPATVADLLGQREPPPFPGRSFAPFLRGTPDAALGADETVLLELKKIGGAVEMKSLVRGSWQYIWNARDGSEELYEMKTDPRELNNLAAAPEQQARMEEFRAHLRKLFPELPIGRPVTSPP